MSKELEEALETIKRLFYQADSVINEKHILITEPSIKFQGGSESHSGGIIRGTQVLQLHLDSKTWIVDRSLRRAYTACKLKPCIHTDLKPGDIAVMSDSNPPELDHIENYKLILPDGVCACWFDGVDLINRIYKYHWKLLF